jgi:uncharacterized membrane protein
MPWIGLLLGALVGASFFGLRGIAPGAAIGAVIGLVLKRSTLLEGGGPRPISSAEAADRQRMALLEQRVAALEAALARSGALPNRPAATAPSDAEPTVKDEAASTTAAESTPAARPPSAGTSVSAPAATPSAYAPVRKGGIGEPPRETSAQRATTAGSATTGESATSAASATSSLWSWFTNGNTLARIGIVVLFFGVAFLLSYLAEHVTVPIELQFAAVALTGVGLIVGGAWLRHTRRAYGLALVGGGLGVLYLTAFAALELVPLLSPTSAFVWLAAISTLAIVLSLAFDAQALAALATLGGLLAPILVQAVTEPLPLFGYVAFVNAVILGVAWFRAWRILDLTGFVGTFLLGLWWGQEYYAPGYLRIVEPFLIGFFAAYVAVPIVHAQRGAAERRVDAVLVFGVPMVAFALQALLVREVSYGLTWSAAIVAAFYALSWLALSRSDRTSHGTLAAAFGALAVIFATLAVPLAVDPRWTSAVWAIEAAGVYWIGCREDRRFARGFALLLQLATGIAFFLGGLEVGDVVFANRRFVGIAAIALSAFATARFGDRRGEALSSAERALLNLVFAWACVWWLGGGVTEVVDHIATRTAPHAILAWVIGSVGVATVLVKPLAWPRLAMTGVLLLPALVLSIAHDVAHGRPTLTEFGWAVYPLAWGLHFALLRRSERVVSATKENARTTALLAAGHAAGAILLVGQVAWEAGEWTARVTQRDTVWAACAHLLPLALYLLAVVRAPRTMWPLSSFADAYATRAGTLVALALALGFVALAILHPGDPSPLAYVPLLNPLEASLVLSLSALYLWARRDARTSPQTLYRAIGIGAFLVLNGIVVRTVHHWLGVAWSLPAILASRPLQAALTLTWTVAALAVMVTATRGSVRILWFAGAGLLAAVVVKLFAVDLAALSGLTRVIAFLGVGALLLVIGYVAPLPPASAETSAGRTTPAGPRST